MYLRIAGGSLRVNVLRPKSVSATVWAETEIVY